MLRTARHDLLSIETAAELRLPLTTFVTHGEVAMSFKSVASYIQSIAPRGKKCNHSFATQIEIERFPD